MVEEDIQVSYARNVAGCRLDIRKYAFSNRIADKQNSLTQDCINCTTINAFKRHIQKTPETGNKTMFVLLWIVSYVGVNLCSLMPSAATSLVQRRCNYTGCLSGHECSLNSAHWCTLFTTKDLHRISQTLYRLLRQQLLAAVFDHLPLGLRTMSWRVHFPSSVSGPSRMQDLLPRTAFQITFVASPVLSPHLQPSEDIWKRFYLLKFLTLPRTFNIVMSAGHLCKWTQNRRWWWRWWWWWRRWIRWVRWSISVVFVSVCCLSTR